MWPHILLALRTNRTAAQKPDRVTLFTQHLALAALSGTKSYSSSTSYKEILYDLWPLSMFTSQTHPSTSWCSHVHTYIYTYMYTLCHCMSIATPACKHSACFDSMQLYKVQGSDDVSVYATVRHHLWDACALQADMHTLLLVTLVSVSGVPDQGSPPKAGFCANSNNRRTKTNTLMSVCTEVYCSNCMSLL